jgi:hypothetical protein
MWKAEHRRAVDEANLLLMNPNLSDRLLDVTKLHEIGNVRSSEFGRAMWGRIHLPGSLMTRSRVRPKSPRRTPQMAFFNSVAPSL